MVPTAEVKGTTRAYVGQGLHLSAGALDVDANANMTALSESRMLSVGALAINAGAVYAIVSGTVDAHVGSAAGSTPSSRLLELDLTGALTVDADATMTATPTVKAATIAVIEVSACCCRWQPCPESSAPTSARESTSAPPASGSKPPPRPWPRSPAPPPLGFSALIGIGVISSEATVSAQVEAFVGAHRSIDTSAVTTTIDVNAGSVAGADRHRDDRRRHREQRRTRPVR